MYVCVQLYGGTAYFFANGGCILQQTEHYQLSLWNQDDRILMETFNGNNAKLDAALKAEADAREASTAALAEAVTKCGNCKIVYGSYAGDGTYGKDNPCTLSFNHKPVFLAICIDDMDSSAPQRLIAIRGAKEAYSFPGEHNSDNTLTWNDKSVSWYDNSAYYQCNASGETYYYVALLAADE